MPDVDAWQALFSLSRECGMSSPAEKLSAAARKQRSRERKALEAEGYLLIDDVQVLPESITYLVAAEVIPDVKAEDLPRVVGRLVDLCARPRLAAAMRREMEQMIEELGFDEQLGDDISEESLSVTL
jgi:hypothetical protein